MRGSRLMIFAAALAVPAASAPATQAPPPPAAAPKPVRAAALGPAVDHHQHLMSPAAEELLGEARGGSAEAVSLPAEMTELLARRTAAWDDAAALAQVYTDDAILVEDSAVTGGKAVAELVSGRFASAYAITPIAYAAGPSHRTIAAMYTRGEGAERKNVGLTLIGAEKDSSGRWRIASESMKFPGPVPMGSLGAETLIELLDQAEIRRAVVMSVAYFFESPFLPKRPDSPARLRAENDWTAAEVGKYPARLLGFCSVNPLTDQALAEMERCTKLGLRGLKLHFGNSKVDLKTAGHLARMKEIFASANRLRMPVAAHLWASTNDYGRRDAELFLEHLLPLTPDIVVQIMHMAGGGPGWTDEALEVLAEAVEKRDPRTRNLYFDVATVADHQTHEQLQLLARRIRQIGPERVLYGSDGAFAGNPPPDKSWGQFRGMVPLTDAEFAVIRDNVAPYLR